ncbi:G protein-activated inward rectifier potassium channel 3-like [Cydia pomonella]|uniref:G protein-activated inward rectifier potassium channel 3-like n=1 Tax=Cydia pomonella TaxID=82600 RepID=UPI002ADDCD70|nr:G protein-activated inward rectifier potassium channel 3-like [Cydia pomonella]
MNLGPTFEPESRRGSRSRALERSLSYSEAIGNGSKRSSIEIPRIVDTDVYNNEELKKQYRISQIEGKEIAFPTVQINYDTQVVPSTQSFVTGSSLYSSEDDQCQGLVMTIDVETDSPTTGTTRIFSDASTRPLESSNVTSDNIYDTIEVVESVYENDHYTGPPSQGYSSRLGKRKKKENRHRRRAGRKTRSRRVVCKDGEENVPVRSNIPAKSIKYARDIVNTVINAKWRFILLMMVAAHFVFWLTFAAIWLAVSSSYSDDIGDGKDHCVIGTSSFAGLLMMAVETQMTIGYGVRYPSEECPEAIIIMVVEIVAGTALSGGLTSLLFTKLVRPNRHVTSVGFSKKATVCLRDGQLCLQFRVWDLLNVHLIDSTITAYILKPIRTLEGEMMQNYIHHLKLKEARAFLLWPITVTHVIDVESPLYEFSAQDMIDYRFEIVVCLTGASKNMGTVTQSRTSYLSKEINWGYRFKNVLRWSKRNEAYVINVEDLNSMEQVETPLCSASHLKHFEIISSADLSIPTSPSFQGSLTKNTSSLSHDQTLSRNPESLPSTVPSTPSFGPSGTQRSLNWTYKRILPENDMKIQ